MLGRVREFCFRILDDPQPVAVALNSKQDTLRVLQFAGSPGETRHAVPAMGGGDDLHVVARGGLKHHVPELGLDGMVDSVFGFFDEEEAVGSIV